MKNKFLKMAVAGLVLSVSGFTNATLIQFNELTGGDINNSSFFSPVNSGDTLEITGSVTQGGSSIDFDKFTVNLLDTWILNATFEIINTDSIVDFTSVGIIKSFTSQEYLNYSSGNAGSYSFDPVPQRNSGTINYTYSFVVGDQTTAVPEPSTLAILGLGLMGLAARRFKKQA